MTVEYSGEVASLAIAPLTIAVLKGLLNPIMEAPVNYVNAPIVAKERGIEVKEVKSSDAGDFTSLIRVRVEAGKKSYQVAGTLYRKKDPRVVEIDQFNVEVVPEGHMLLILNIDRPGVIGMVGKVLGDNQINIVRMQCALEKRAGTRCSSLDPMRSSRTRCLRRSNPAKTFSQSKSRLCPNSRAPSIRSAMVSAPPKPRLSSGQVPSFRERSLVPVGMATILPHAAKQVRRLEEQLLAQVNRWGYDEIILPTFEYLDVLAPGLEPELIEHCYQFVDRTTGRTLLLRPDATAQIARTVAMGLTGATLPLRLSYRTSVFRYEQEHAGRGREIFQVGAELIGLDDVTSDSEVIGLMIECLRTIGLQSFKVSLGHVGFIKGLLMRSGLSAHGQKLAEQATARKDLPRLEAILASEHISKMAARAIREAPELYGQEEVLARGRVLAAGDPALAAPLERLAQVYQLLCAAGHRESLLLDLGEFRGFDYYDGVVFDVFAEGMGAELGGGGRYDHLIGRFGRPLPSTGFGLDVDRLFRTVEFPEEGSVSARVDYLVAAPRRATRLLTAVAAQLRRTRSRVVQQTMKGSDAALLSAAVTAGLAQQAAAVVVVGAPGMDHDDVLVVESLAAHGHGRRTGNLSRLSKKMGLADLVAAARRSRRQVKERS